MNDSLTRREHHAVVRLPEGVTGPRLGAVVAVVPSHICTSVNLVDELLVVQDREGVDRWQVTARGVDT
ncbi:hypothetical protein [Streptomyces sp. SP2-10]|uniref:hypothetical protein n=1 Tax=Streptomyces sp. SP2-10 TaxID=2873385 RepID=UPI0027DF5A95|nr:hypothetical protein [Streptomyces sp. SP2-10]